MDYTLYVSKKTCNRDSNGVGERGKENIDHGEQIAVFPAHLASLLQIKFPVCHNVRKTSIQKEGSNYTMHWFLNFLYFTITNHYINSPIEAVHGMLANSLLIND